MISQRLQVLGVAALLILLGSVRIAEAAAARGEDTVLSGVQDLAYGEVLFYFFQDDYFSALTRLLAAEARGELMHHATEAELLLGGLYLSYGQHLLAGEIFERLLEQSVDSEVHDRAWLFLAKIWYQRGYLAEARAALARIKNRLDVELESERQMLSARVLMDQGRFDQALTILEAWHDPEAQWVGYAKYNIGVTLVRLDRVAEGAAILDSVGQLDLGNPALRGLRDKANLALGYAWLQAGRPLEAKAPLQRVRLNGPFSNKALLGVGWSDAAVESFDAALVPWMELRQRSLLDPAVQEALLAVPYAFSRLGADEQAATHYLNAVAAFDVELSRVESSIDSVKAGEFIASLLDAEVLDASGWQWRMAALPDSNETRYLYELVASHRFQEGLKNYRDLQFLRGNLDRWLQSLGAFDDILDARQRAFDQRLPLLNASLARMDLGEIAGQLENFESRLAAVEGARDVVALATSVEQDQSRRLQRLESQLSLLGDDPSAQELRRKQRFLQGVLLWDVERDYKVRLWREQRSLRELDAQLTEARRTYRQVDNARSEWPQEFAALTERIALLEPRVLSLAAQIGETLAQQARYLEGIAVEELQAQRQRLNTYRVQARFALASVYDRATARTDPPAIDGNSLHQLAEAGQ
ncbi:MAG: hypothetical protein O6765_06990 [Gammaproteobacteria bacterium]|nr:hypothetical protein [Gammaproteobacteria bacterium]